MIAAARAEALDVLVVGAGFGGLYALHKLRAMGWRTRALDAAPSVGGTWWANRYPGARVDIQSLEYSYSFSESLQQDWHWTERYAAQPELLRYADHVADRFDLRRDLQLDTRVTGARFDEAACRWQVETDRGAWSARFLVLAIGPLSSPNLPAFDGLDRFAGQVLHSAAWPLAPVDLAGRHVAVIGTGSSAVQIIPIVAAQAETLTVFQRTPAYAVPARNGPLDPAWEARIKADYAGFRARNRRMYSGFGCELSPRPMSALDAAAGDREAAFEERWGIGGFSLLGAFPDLLTNLRSNELAADFVRRKIREIVRDPVTASRLCPGYPIGCKRLCVDTGYYDAYNQPGVRLVDIGADPIEAITPGGLRAGGRDHRFDTLILATGFDAYTGPLLRIDLRGRDGLRIEDKWRAGPLNYLGLTIAGFPNLFYVAGPGSPSAFTNFFVAVEHHVDWIADCISWLDARGGRAIEASESAEAAWVAQVNLAPQRTVFTHCNSWYLGANIPGKPRVFLPLVGGFPAYAERCAAVAERGYDGFVVR
ncbi:MAG: NAD(P)/FAD-dependent oxidoreductase [Deltaproteobacteria bacterium]|nr:MAG: NAD(P)/FAD-dependent oxidoreductase [Deltaproteobacteria bacterium]TMQ16250.1 MAG: NAD(P)/FAD-dependent oxidoreductase [Deltaproteobacteria bacterium]